MRLTLPRLNAAYIVGAARTPVGKFNGALKSVSAIDLGITAAKAAVQRSKVPADQIDEFLFGQVLTANSGQAPARQVVIKGGFPESVEATTINKVCSSGLKTVALAAQAIKAGDRNVIVAGGMESMSNTPYYSGRGLVFGNQKLEDSIVKDGLWDPYNNIHMGNCCENTNKRDGITREQQDEYAIESYRRANESIKNGAFKDEIVPVEIKTRKGTVTVSEDEEPKGANAEKLKGLKPVFDKQGSVTAGNASPINDGASAVVVASGTKAKELGTPVLAKIVSYADAATAPIDFTIAPSLAIPAALKKAGLTKDDIALWEINEAFSGVALANLMRLGIDKSKVNVKGGAVALGHPIGASGNRIFVTLVNALKEGEYGVAAICNGGGASTAIVIKKVSSVE
ncbi:peroxisomal acetoacetyl-CoA thiolase [Yarrowia lipolytica]|jgi:acetyl-CoA C-acetyltransferase|uniref:Acetyl-CoA acetyltransferase n=2 Tax=Yarrowia lipolytica TaxID=4952 RepID=THIL_YARLI|nr:YALI0E11099p [Yarrowia lipolytica CLIB122]Q6L8K7.1 RecName: Full=Acetyl-CoA acetyltransferase; AltName: Full=Peroxisomal acetoacetyl-CoA thiolase; Short=Thiolase [Yarrowia lipolytica CLIB122]AOW05263.1 hypothetical protein YALI1_E13899g [Yarrowia lipolytica]KAB8283841.1 peroxisomal acetoacetyl-CoA thiolase [Yarrowia lipolytica]KAE8172766.1 peroxisomal acetoacetyl-CoA thiolase [Yarrowia lipolytica]KAJ8056786.1 peroxisomal acetoacetyl-CoA thiolase [Yarrowia lipolytica]QNQ00222.1 Acetyl-CoA a|eukprot:XP_503808.1 YALI0E11099p [Yarrowia lipolytica CLIB122]